MNPVETVRAFWEHMQRRDWHGVRATLAEDVVVEWPVTNETFFGADHVVAVNAEYPEGWEIRVVRLVGSGSLVVAEVEVPQAEVGVFRTAAFMEVVDGRITRSVEYWVHLGGEEPPAWRRSLAERFSTGSAGSGDPAIDA
ncbi:nuclear transport factor 2 family protein [Nesterenkonia sp. HG001]|uniref:nuclear transport factor 2 family protein n=1 Tax=Nesterenkonia sp. HG001 TaxID=2983207 RepID=UPI002AC5AD0B|nr:nuclear transport factor 2 family protein [Nesterenkonia sp. HG001]MDZ5078783.1 nuclear transport factor 2 family protein [Nesterenkonia sp. HG001]